MKKFVVKYRKLWCALFVAMVCLHLAGCSTAWTSEASNIISLLVPAIEAALGILTAFGVGLSPTTLTTVQSWATQAQTGLSEVKALITQYNTAIASAQPGILAEIQTVLGVVSSNLAMLLPTLHVTDAKTEAEIATVFSAVADEISALIGLVPALQGKITDHDAVKALMAQLKSAKAFRSDFNAKAGVFGKAYEI